MTQRTHLAERQRFYRYLEAYLSPYQNTQKLETSLRSSYVAFRIELEGFTNRDSIGVGLQPHQ